MAYRGGCHCGAIGVELHIDGAPEQMILGACQCSFCRKHNARAFSHPRAAVALTAHAPNQVQHYAFGLHTAQQILCRRCGVYIAMLLRDGADLYSVLNIDTLKARAEFTGPLEPRVYDAEDAGARIARRKARWTPTRLIGWPAPDDA